MSTLIQCPACSQKFNLQGRLPALFTCTKCQQPMDLTGFPGYVPEEPAAPAARSAPERGGGRSSARRRGRGRDEEDDDGGRRGRLEPKKNNTPLLVGSIVGFIALIAVVIVVMSKKEKPPPAPVNAAGTGSGAPGVPGAPIDVAVAPGVPGTVAPGSGVPLSPAPGTPASGAPALGAPGAPLPGSTAPGATEPGAAPAKPKSSSTGSIKSWDTPEDVTSDERKRIDEALETALNQVGIEQRKAEDALVQMGRKAIWRLVSEFKHIFDIDTFESRKGLMKAMIVDRILRKIDGYMERKSAYKKSINPESHLEYSSGVAKTWNKWLENGYYKTVLAPWDERVDGQDEMKERPAPRGNR